MPFDIFKITKSDLEDYLKENPSISTPFFLQDIFYWNILPKEDAHKAIQYFADLVPEYAEAVINYEHILEERIPDFLYLKAGENLKDKVYVEIKGQALITAKSLYKQRVFH